MVVKNFYKRPTRKGSIPLFFGQIEAAIPVTGRGGPYGCEMLRTHYCLENRLTGGG
jgi:hypothetical protein